MQPDCGIFIKSGGAWLDNFRSGQGEALRCMSVRARQSGHPHDVVCVQYAAQSMRGVYEFPHLHRKPEQ